MERWQKPEAEIARGRTLGYHSVDKSSSLDYNTPLRSVRGDPTSAPSPFYKLSAELSRESLRIPGAVPFMWEQSPGRRKFTGAASPSRPPVLTPYSATIPKPQATGSLVAPESGASTLAVDPAKPSLATLFRQPSLKGSVVTADIPRAADSANPDVPSSLAIPQILPPPAADHPRTSSARYSVYRNTTAGTSFYNAASQIDNNDNDDAVSDDATSDAVTATAGGDGFSIDDSLVLSGDLRPASTPSQARDFIMHRFLPAAHTLACESPLTPSRRFVQTVGVGAMPGSPSIAAGSFRDYTGTACRPSPLRYASVSSTPANSNARQMCLPRGQLQAGSFHGEAEEEEKEEEEEEEEPPFTPKSCGIFPFRITISFQNRRTSPGVHESSRRNLSASKHQHSKQQQQKKGCKSINCAGSTTRIMDILRDDQSSSHDGESPVHTLRGSRPHSEAERERIRIAVLEKAGLMHLPNDCRLKPPSVAYYRESPNLHQLLTAQHAGSVEPFREEGSDYSSYQDAPSRFQSPSPAAFHIDAKALRAQNAHAPQLVAQRTRAFAPGAQQDDHRSAGIISTTEKHLLNSSFYYYNKQSNYKPHIYQPQLNVASPSTYHTPLSSHVGGAPPHQNCAYHDNLSSNIDSNSVSSREKANYQDIKEELWDLGSPQSSPKTHIVSNALFEHENQEDNMIANTKWTALNHHKVNGDPHIGGTGDHHVIDNGKHNVSSNSHYIASKDDPHYVISGDNHVINGHNHVTSGHNPLINANNHLISNGDMYVSTNGDVHALNANSSVPSKSLPMTPPLPKSPTHSWLDRAMPLVASHSNTKRVSGTASSRLSHMCKASIPPADDYGAAPVLTSNTRKQGSSEASKWEALVKGSHLQPGHLRFSEELLHQSQNFMKVGASY